MRWCIITIMDSFYLKSNKSEYHMGFCVLPSKPKSRLYRQINTAWFLIRKEKKKKLIVWLKLDCHLVSLARLEELHYSSQLGEVARHRFEHLPKKPTVFAIHHKTTPFHSAFCIHIPTSLNAQRKLSKNQNQTLRSSLLFSLFYRQKHKAPSPIKTRGPTPQKSLTMYVVEESAKPTKMRWGELDEEDGEALDFLLPPKQVIGPDENGIKKETQYKFNDDGNKVKITTTTRVRKLANARLSKRAVERRNWSKFGDAINEDVGSRLTMVSTEEILLERPRAHVHALENFNYKEKALVLTSMKVYSDGCAVWKILTSGAKAEETKIAGDNLAQLGKGGAVLMVCRTCGKKGDHWTSRCPYKDLAQPPETFIDKPAATETAMAASGATKGAYVPPSMRVGAERIGGSDMRRRNDENSVRVTNLSEDTREPDLLELFRTFGSVSRVYVAIDQKTGVSRGFGFVNFLNKEDAERAINKLNGYGYDNLILRVEWATPRSN
ncbi:hypothetical protein DKX38_016303 [Salix brachista]|uniref:Eukaryotic translation initiation factor 3 subunit G n=1 Tax=Salix brachista TaxID=2182728 RepID=A0A5N5L867_9ROSI|nr:hypothetical protein DKX38_016303 [Salix brachista]